MRLRATYATQRQWALLVVVASLVPRLKTTARVQSGNEIVVINRHGMTRDSFMDGGKWLLSKCDCLRPCNFPFVGSRVIVGLHDQASLRV